MSQHEDPGVGGAIVNFSEQVLTAHDNPHNQAPYPCSDIVLGCLAALCFVTFLVCELLTHGYLTL